MTETGTTRIAVVIPCYRVTAHVADVIARIGPEVTRIFAVDDACPDGSGDVIEETVTDPRVTVLRHEVNKGVGGAVVTGYRAALEAGSEIVIKVDGDGQMDPALIGIFAAPLIAGEADYAKGNRFHSATALRGMPKVRLLGNAALSFMTKLSSGYWHLFDPTNGYTAIHRDALAALDLRTLSERYFFETDMLIRLGDIRAVAVDIPMHSVYADEKSGLRIGQILAEFLTKHLKATIRRIVYMYFLRDFNIASLNLLLGLCALVFGMVFGIARWIVSVQTGVPATTGTVMVAALPVLTGIQMILFFFGYDIAAEPRRAIQASATPTALPPAELPPAEVAAPTQAAAEEEDA